MCAAAATASGSLRMPYTDKAEKPVFEDPNELNESDVGSGLDHAVLNAPKSRYVHRLYNFPLHSTFGFVDPDQEVEIFRFIPDSVFEPQTKKVF